MFNEYVAQVREYGILDTYKIPKYVDGKRKGEVEYIKGIDNIPSAAGSGSWSRPPTTSASGSLATPPVRLDSFPFSGCRPQPGTFMSEGSRATLSGLSGNMPFDAPGRAAGLTRRKSKAIATV